MKFLFTKKKFQSILFLFIGSIFSYCKNPEKGQNKIENETNVNQIQNPEKGLNKIENETNENQIQNPKKAFIFDFDWTLTIKHTKGTPLNKKQISKTEFRFLTINDIFGNQKNINNIINMLKKLKNKGYSIFLNTRGVKKQVKEILKKTMLLEYIDEIFGAENENDIGNALSYQKVWEGKAKINDGKTQWSYIKTHFLDQISKKGFNVNDIYFFDDDEINIEEAKKKYKNSFRITGKIDGTISEVNRLLE